MDKLLSKYLSPKQKQWAWFVILWCFGLFCVMSMGAVIKFIMNI
ncbi:hypothetical protein SAMN05519226_2322 [Cycloclasticus pugetii]|uniref:DUF2474 domain-containing protein n=1 Tax=Cycloclasticus pugetii TaxID=34068 RepID=A0AB33YZB0_9GAMM|nr:hypothetical protein L196_10599 [Cycloclasticus pugetii]SHJ55660.1 hypothetical protein SAMN05519226_2322 [Cycloclasticus pugetii]